MCDCATAAGPAAGFRFWTAADANLLACFDGGLVTSDGGLPWVARAEESLGVCAVLAACVPEGRGGPVPHSLVPRVRPRVFRYATGYTGQEDGIHPRPDPWRILGA